MWAKLKRLIWQWHVVLITAPSVASLVILMRLLGVLQPLEWAMLDQYFCWRPLNPPDQRITLIGITDGDLRKYGWPTPDGILAQLITKLKQNQPRAIGLDLYRDLPAEPGYQQLVQVFRSTPNLIGIEKIISGLQAGPIAPNAILHKLDQVGSNDAIEDADGRMRRGLLYLENAEGQTVYSLAFRLAYLYLHVPQLKPETRPDGSIGWGKGILVPFKANDGGYVHTNDQGFQILINFRGPQGYFQRVSLQDVLENRVPDHLLRDRIVLIGLVAESISDYVKTPFSAQTEKQLPPRMAGVEIIANVTSQILSTALDGRAAIRTWSEPAEWLWILTWATLGAIISWQQRSGSELVPARWLKTGLTIVMAVGILFVVSYLAFLQSWWIPVIPPLAALLGSAIAVTGYIAQLATEIRRTFGRYLTSEVVTSLLETPRGLQLGGEKRKITILMSDLRGFSAISERLPPEQVVTFLNLYLETMTEVVTQYGGLINQVIGDGIVIFFGALKQKPDDAERAVACAIAMQLAMKMVNQRNQILNLPAMEMGIGVNTGEVIVGNIGSLKHAQFTAIGKHVNLAARIESLSVGGQILVSPALVEEVPTLKVRRRTQARMKGMQSPITVYEISGIGGAYNLFLPDLQTTLLTLPKAILINYTLVEDKHLVGHSIPGRLIKLSSRGAEVCSEQAIAPLSDIKINLASHRIDLSEDIYLEDIYAKVTEVAIGDITCFRVHFTDISPQMVESLLRLR
jgi:adenylate cyclase